MKKYTLLVLFLLIAGSSFAQITLIHHFSGNINTEIGEVLLERSGKKLVVTELRNTRGPYNDTIFFYNPDFSFWKMIPCPYMPGRVGQFNFYRDVGTAIGIFYPSERLFNLDTLLEVFVNYWDSAWSATSNGQLFLINENGAVIDSILNVNSRHISNVLVKGDTFGNYSLYVPMVNGADVYSLPGSLPCVTCVSGSVYVGGVATRPSIISQPVPNPSQDRVKITFNLPEGTDMAELQLYNMEGKHINTYKVDGRFGYLMLDNSLLPPGMYLYNIVAQGQILSTQKFVVIR